MERLLASRLSTGTVLQLQNQSAPKPAKGDAKPLPTMPEAVIDVAPKARPKLHSITGGRAISNKTTGVDVLPKYFGGTEPQPPPVWPRRPDSAPAHWLARVGPN